MMRYYLNVHFQGQRVKYFTAPTCESVNVTNSINHTSPERLRTYQKQSKHINISGFLT
jgi:hypothetical protein